MHNWSVNTSRLKKNVEEYKKFILEQSINFGLNDKKLSLASLKKYWKELDIDENKRAYLKKIVWSQS